MMAALMTVGSILLPMAALLSGSVFAGGQFYSVCQKLDADDTGVYR